MNQELGELWCDKGMLWFHHRDTFFNGLDVSSSLILSLQTSNHGEILYENSLIPCPSHFTNTSLHHGKCYTIKLNFILDSSFPCCAWLCCHTHAHHTYSCFSSILPPPCGCLITSYLDMPFSDSIDRFDINMYIQYDSI